MPKEKLAKKKKKSRATKSVMLQRYDALEELLAFGYRRAYILQAMKDRGVGERQVEKMTTEIYAGWNEEKKANVAEKRERQERRILQTIRSVGKPSERARFEAIYARIAGTEAERRGGDGAGGADGAGVPIKLIFEDYRAPEATPAPKKKR